MNISSSKMNSESDHIDENRAKRRRKRVSETCSHFFNQHELNADFEPDRQHLFAETRLSTAYAVPFLYLIVTATSVLWLQPFYVGAWLILALGAHFLCVATSHAYQKYGAPQKNEAIWSRRFFLSDLFYGASWALFFLLPQTPNAGEGFIVFQFATLLIAIAINTLQSATLPICLLASTLPMTLIVIYGLLESVSSIHFTLTALAIGVQGFFLLLGQKLYTNATKLLEYRAEKDFLITELETANAISDEARRRAEAANLAKSRFLATMSHELRTPLNAILGFSEIMKDQILGPLENPNYRSYAQDIHGSGEHLLHLINEILDLSRIEAGRHELVEEAIHLTHVVEECCAMMKMRAEAKSIALNVERNSELAPVWADERAIRQVLLNLLSNAIKFTPEHGSIELCVARSQDGGQFVQLSDTGPGIPEDEIPIVLEAFGQGSHAIRSAEPGTGLGLSIVQALVKMHNGEFALDSEADCGTQVTVTLPASRVMNFEAQTAWVEPDTDFIELDDLKVQSH